MTPLNYSKAALSGLDWHNHGEPRLQVHFVRCTLVVAIQSLGSGRRMEPKFTHARVNDIVRKVRQTLGEAVDIVWRWESRGRDPDDEEKVGYFY
jgi:hypothetical protein